MQQFDKHIYRILLGSVAVLLAVGTLFYHHVEHFSWVDAYYFCVVSLATVGYGDLVPHTDIGKIFTTFYIIIGVGILTTFISYNFRRTAHRMTHRQEIHDEKVARKAKKKNEHK